MLDLCNIIEMVRAQKLENRDTNSLTILLFAVFCYDNTGNKTHRFTPYKLIFGHTSGWRVAKLYNKKELIAQYIRELNTEISHYYKIVREGTKTQKEISKLRLDKNLSTPFSMQSKR